MGPDPGLVLPPGISGLFLSCSAKLVASLGTEGLPSLLLTFSRKLGRPCPLLDGRPHPVDWAVPPLDGGLET